MKPEKFDCVILGTGPAGMTALIYLARFHRRVIALGSVSRESQAKPRVLLIDRTYNLPGYPEGISGQTLLANLCEQALAAGGETSPHLAEHISGQDGDFTIHLENGTTLEARKIILAMGIRDREPDIPGITPYIGDFVRYCPICDGYEHTGTQLGILGSGLSVARHALFLRSFSDHITVFLHGTDPNDLGHYNDILAQRGINVYSARIAEILKSDADDESQHKGCGVLLEDGSRHSLAVLYSALGCNVNRGPVEHLPLRLDDEGYIVTDLNQATSVAGIYAAGDVTSQLNQITIAQGQAAVAAINVHNALDDP
jgi:thioredoxin reductase (NADPH)